MMAPPPAGTTREHLGLAMALKVPIFIVVSKVDLCSRSTVERTVRQLERFLKLPGCCKVPVVVSSTDDAVTTAQKFAQSPRYVGVNPPPPQLNSLDYQMAVMSCRSG